MSNQNFRFGEIIPFDAKMELGTIPVGFLSRLSDGKYLDGASWNTPRVSNDMSPVANNPNLYRFLFDTALGKKEDTYTFEPENTSLFTTRENEVISATVSQFLNTLQSAVARILGLSHENIVITDVKYDSNKRPLSSKIRTYDSAANATAKGTLGLQDTYITDATFDAEGKMLTYTQTRVGS